MYPIANVTSSKHAEERGKRDGNKKLTFRYSVIRYVASEKGEERRPNFYGLYEMQISGSRAGSQAHHRTATKERAHTPALLIFGIHDRYEPFNRN